MQNLQAAINELDKYTVNIKTDRSIGTGLIVTNDGLILTCYHVIGDPENNSSLFHDIEVYFSDTKKAAAQVVEEYCRPDLDIAFLQLKEGRVKMPEQTVVAPLSERSMYGHDFASIGFRKTQLFEKLGAFGKIQIITSLKKNNNDDDDLKGENKESSAPIRPLIQLYSDQIEEGMSGAGVLDLETNRVVGIISLHHPAIDNTVDTQLNFAIPISSVLESSKAATILKEMNPGLRPIFEFLRKIDVEENMWYQRIDYIFVPPLEYDDIENALRMDRLVFITGTKEYGKTYTAVRLLWEYYLKGYEPKYIRTKNEDKIYVRERLNTIESQLKPHHIIYFEDPFGKITYQQDEDLERDIGAIIDTVKNSHDTYVVITSREEVFKEFEKKRISEINIKEFEKKLNIKTPSYNYEKRKEILLKCAEIVGCEWLVDESRKNFVLESIQDERKLSSPLKIRDFTIATKKVTTKEEILYKINAKSIETAKSFAKEIKLMSQDKILFLSFPFIMHRYSDQMATLDFIRARYKDLVQDLRLELAWDFDRVLEWFKDDKIDIGYNGIINLSPEFSEKPVIRFSHPSYQEALKYIIDENGTLAQSGRILSLVLQKLASIMYTSNLKWDIISTIIYNYDKWPEDVKNLIVKLAEDSANAFHTCITITHHYNEISASAKEVLFKLADIKDAYWGLTIALFNDYYTLPEDIRNLLFQMIDNKEKAVEVVSAITSDSFGFESLPHGVRIKLLLKLSNILPDNHNVSRLLTSNYDRLPDN
jgi:hypothetical protein